MLAIADHILYAVPCWYGVNLSALNKTRFLSGRSAFHYVVVRKIVLNISKKIVPQIFRRKH